ncbi:MAG: glycosyltransferase [Dolichospermum sp.]
MFINFCMRQHPDFGGTYTAQVLFSRAIECYFIDLQIPGFDSPSEANYTIKGSINPFLAYIKASSFSFFNFIPDEVKQQVKGVIIHGSFLSHFSYGLQLSKHLQIPLYLVPHGTADPYVFSYGRIKKLLWLNILGNYAARYAEKIIFTAKAELEKSLFSFSKSKGVICPLSVEVPKDLDHNRKIDNRKLVREELGFSETDKILLYFSKIDKFKRPLETIQAFIKVRPKGWKLLVIGYCHDPNFYQQVKLYSNKDNVLIFPPIYGQEKWKYLLASDLFVLFSHRENFSLAAIESAAVGLPIYISKGVDTYPYFQSNTNLKMVFDIQSPIDIELALKSLSSLSDDELQKMGSHCRNVVLQNFTYENFVKCLHSALKIV